MRIMAFATLLALAALPAVAGVPAGGGMAVASPVSTQPLAINEVLLELGAVGTATSRADLATLTANLVSRGATDADARRERDRQLRRLTAAARRFGVAESDVEAGDPVVSPDYDATMMDAMSDACVDAGAAVAEADMAADSTQAEAPPETSACTQMQPETPSGIVLTTAVDVRLRNPDRADDLMAALTAAGAESMLAPTYSVTDQGAARRTARAQALASARADADAYAASLGLRVVRIVRVTERTGMDLMSLMTMGTNPMMANMFESAGQTAQGPDIPTFVMVGVDFALAPQ